MLSIGKMGSGQEVYYLALSAEDYYLEGGEPPGHWWGEAAEHFRLTGKVQREDLSALLRGFSPRGDKLVQNAGKENRCPGWDLTFSAPKSVSVLWSQADEATRREIQCAQQAAVEAALSYLQDVAAFSRRGQGGFNHEHAQLVVATFEHGTSRAGDPHLHTHCLFANMALRSDGTTGTVHSPYLFDHKMAGGAVYRAQLAYELERRLGLECERHRTWFELKGVAKTLCDFFSTRRKEVEERLNDLGLETASAAAFATLDTRKAKELVAARNELFRQWQVSGTEHGFSQKEVTPLLAQSKAKSITREYERSLAEGVQVITDHESHFGEKDIVRRVMEASQGSGLDAGFILDVLRQDLEHSGRFMKLCERDGELRYTTREMLQVETELLEQVERAQRDLKHKIPRPLAEIIINEKQACRQLNFEQGDAVRHLTQTEGDLKILSGIAGSGKSTTLRTCREVWEKEGYTVIGAALGGNAAKELKKSAGMETHTLALLEQMMNPSVEYRAKHAARQLLRAAMKKPTYKIKSLRFNEKMVLVIDEAAMIGTRQLARIYKAVREAGAKLVLAGDDRQLPPIEAGCPFTSLSKRLGAAELQQIARQRAEADRQVVRDAAAGEAQAVLRSLAWRGRLHVPETRAAATTKLVADWARDNPKGLSDTLVLAATREEVRLLNRRCQDQRILDGQVDVSRGVATDADVLYVGDRVLFKKNDYKIDVRNGMLGTVTGVKPRAHMVCVKTDDGDYVLVNLKRYKIREGEDKGQMALKLGYAATDWAAQGATAEQRAYVLLAGPMTDRSSTYVEVSRARAQTHVYTDTQTAGPELSDLVRQMRRVREKTLAHDVQQEHLLSMELAM